MYSQIYTAAKDIYRVYSGEKEKSRHPEHLPPHILILFQKFKKAYESKNIEDLKDTISDRFVGDIYGKTKSSFITLIAHNFQHLFKYGSSPHLTLEVLKICSGSDVEFAAIINMKSSYRFFGISTPVSFDAVKLFCEVQPEGQDNCWRITKLKQYNK